MLRLSSLLLCIFIISCRDKPYDTSKAVNVFSQEGAIEIDYSLSKSQYRSSRWEAIEYINAHKNAEIFNGAEIYLSKSGELFRIKDGVKSSIKTNIKAAMASNIVNNEIAILGKNGVVAIVDVDSMSIKSTGTISGEFASTPLYDGKNIYVYSIEHIASAYAVSDFSKLWDFKNQNFQAHLRLKRSIFSISERVIAFYTGSDINFIDIDSGLAIATVSVKDDATQSALSIDGANGAPQHINAVPVIIIPTLEGIIGIHPEYFIKIWSIKWKSITNVHHISGTTLFAFVDSSQNLITADAKTGTIKWFAKIENTPLYIWNNENLIIFAKNKIIEYDINTGDEKNTSAIKLGKNARFIEDKNTLFIAQ